MLRLKSAAERDQAATRTRTSARNQPKCFACFMVKIQPGGEARGDFERFSHLASAPRIGS